MREELLSLINNTIVFKYDLPNSTLDIDRSIFSSENDRCFSSSDDSSLVDVIYNSIIEYSFNEFEMSNKDLNNLHTIALKTKLKYNENMDETAKIKYGFHGEVLLFCILYAKMNARPVISRGYFYNPLEGSETKGYDSYHLIERDGNTELWFGEVKFRTSHKSGIDSAIDGLEKAISDDYLSKNMFALINHKTNFNITGTKIEEIINNWEENPYIDMIEEIKKHDIKLVYPIIIIYDEKDNYDNSILEAINHIKEKHTLRSFLISIPYSIYFIWLPVKKVRDIKVKVIEWIELKKPLI